MDDDTSKADMVRACRALGELKCTYGVYYTFGNHDKGYYPSDYRGYSGADLKENLEKNNVHVMEDDVELIDNRFYIIGRADKSEEYGAGRKNMEELVKDLDPDKFSNCFRSPTGRLCKPGRLRSGSGSFGSYARRTAFSAYDGRKTYRNDT